MNKISWTKLIKQQLKQNQYKTLKQAYRHKEDTQNIQRKMIDVLNTRNGKVIKVTVYQVIGACKNE